VTAMLNTSGAERRSLWVSVDEPSLVLGNSLRPQSSGLTSTRGSFGSKIEIDTKIS
jgi:hypothetical protein